MLGNADTNTVNRLVE
jgi:hypothetical protein